MENHARVKDASNPCVDTAQRSERVQSEGKVGYAIDRRSIIRHSFNLFYDPSYTVTICMRFLLILCLRSIYRQPPPKEARGMLGLLPSQSCQLHLFVKMTCGLINAKNIYSLIVGVVMGHSTNALFIILLVLKYFYLKIV